MQHSTVVSIAVPAAWVLFDAAVKSFVLLAATMGVAWILRNRAAATIHRLWTLAFCGLVVMPVVSALIPNWSLSILPANWSLVGAKSEAIADSVGTDFGGNRPANHERSPVAGTTGDRSLIPQGESIAASTPVSTASVTSDADAASVESAETTRSVTKFTQPSIASSAKQPVLIVRHKSILFVAVMLAWLAGVSVYLLRILRDHFLVHKILFHSDPVIDSSWTDVVRSAANALRLTRNVQLRSTPQAISPMIAGILRPVVIIPHEARDWDPSRRGLVLLHEMAHAKRHDLLSQTLAQLVCAVHWFNPLAWYGLSQMRKFRELACDDLVLESGYRPSDYAHVLLDVARKCRDRSPVTAVCMAQSCDVDNRITAILDSVRSHLSLTKKTARILLALTAVIVAVVAPMRLQCQADQPAAVKPGNQKSNKTDPAKPTNDKQKADDTAPEFRKMTIHVKDENGKPIPDAQIKVGVWEMNNKRTVAPRTEFVTGKDGSVEAKLPNALFILRLFASHPDYARMYVNFDRGQSDIGPSLPQSYDFTMQHGDSIGGRVVDQNGQPIAGVRISLGVSTIRSIQKEETKSQMPKASVLIDATETQLTSDESGRWKFDHVPKESSEEGYEFRLTFEHKDFGSDFYAFGGDQNYVKMKKAHGITIPMLRSGESKIVMNRGTRISGTVVDSSGSPVAIGSITWNEWLDKNDEGHEVALDAKGEFRTAALAPGEYPLTLIAPGFMPELRKIRVPESTDPLRITLKPGKRLSIRFVDSQGKPIPKVYVYFQRWRGLQSTGQASRYIPNRADDDGLYVWEGAPDDAVSLRFAGSNVAHKEMALVAKDSEHVVTLSPNLEISGRVTDAQTKMPIEKFLAIPVIVFRPQFLSTDFHRQVNGQGGQYRMQDVNLSGDDRRFHVRIQADGYRTALSERTFASTDGKVECDFAMERASALPSRVIDRSGKPVAGAVVIQATPTVIPHLHNNVVDTNSFNEIQSIKTDNDGRFEIPASFEPCTIRVIHDLGFAEVTRQVDEAPGTITLLPWARISGTLKQNGNPIHDERVSFDPVIRPTLGQPRFQGAYSVQTDAKGQFEFDRLPPIAGEVGAFLGPWRDSILTSSHGVPVALAPGENRQVSLGGDGITVAGKVVATGRGEVELNKKWSINWLIRRNGGIDLPAGFPTLGFDPTTPVQASWNLDHNFRDWLSTRDHYFVKLSPDGDFKINGVPAGEYDLLIGLYEQPAGCLVETIGQRAAPIIVTESDISAGQKDVGQVDVECRVGPRIGQSMQAYKFVDINGREQSIYDMKGSHVLMHVWASWCAPCIEKMPGIDSAVKNATGKPITFVGLNIDDDARRAMELVSQNKWNWSQNYLGGHSDMAKQLAISSVPTYYLINPEGLLITSTNDWTIMEKKLESLK